MLQAAMDEQRPAGDVLERSPFNPAARPQAPPAQDLASLKKQIRKDTSKFVLKSRFDVYYEPDLDFNYAPNFWLQVRKIVSKKQELARIRRHLAMDTFSASQKYSSRPWEQTFRCQTLLEDERVLRAIADIIDQQGAVM